MNRPAVNLDDWLESQKRKSEEVNKRIETALEFMRSHYGDRDGKVLSEIRCIDFSKSVTRVSLSSGTRLIGYKDPRVTPYRSSYFTLKGHPAHRLGIATESRLHYEDRKTGKKYLAHKTVEKVIREYEVMRTIPETDALRSTCAPAADTWSIYNRTVLAGGGGLQFLIPRSNQFLRFLEDRVEHRRQL